MALTHKPVFAQTPKTAVAVCATAVTGLTGLSPTNTVQLMTAGAEGAIVTRLRAIPRATVTATALYLFLSKDGTDKYLILTKLLPAVTVDSTSDNPSVDFDFSETEPLRLEAGDQLFVGIGVSVGGGIAFSTQFSDF